MPKTTDPEKKPKHRAHTVNRAHAHNEVHIHIGDKKKPRRRRRKPKAGHGGAVVSTMHVSAPIYAQPSYAFPANRPQFFDPTTQVDRERNQIMANAPVFQAAVPQGNGFNPPAPHITPPITPHTTPPRTPHPPLTEREINPPMVNTYTGPAEKIAATPHRTPFTYQSDASWRSPSYFSGANPMHHSTIGEFEDENAASRRAKQQEEEDAEREREWEAREVQRELARKAAAFDNIQIKSAQKKTEKAVTRLATKTRKAEEETARIAALAEKKANTTALSATTRAANKAAREAEASQKAANDAGQSQRWGRVQTTMGSFLKG